MAAEEVDEVAIIHITSTGPKHCSDNCPYIAGTGIPGKGQCELFGRTMDSDKKRKHHVWLRCAQCVGASEVCSEE